jgi:hypothetical protein
MSEVSQAAARDNAIGTQREGLQQQIAGVQARLEKKGVGAAFYRAAKPDPVGDMGFMGSLLFHAVLSGALEDLIGAHLPVGNEELHHALALGTMEGISALCEEQEERHGRRPKSAFYPLGRNRKSVIKDKKAGKPAGNVISRFCPEVQSELAFMFELMDTLNKLETQECCEAANNKNAHIVVRASANPGYQGVERRRRPRPEGMFSA